MPLSDSFIESKLKFELIKNYHNENYIPEVDDFCASLCYLGSFFNR